MVAELITELSALGVTLALEGDRLRVHAPHGALTADLRERIRRAKPALLAFMRAAEDGATPAIPVVDRTAGAPLGVVQQRMWLLERLEPGTTAYNLPGAWRMTGALDVAAFARALNEVIRRHEVTRACIDWDGNHPIQRAVPTLDVPLALEDLRDIAPADREPDLLRRMAAQRARIFDLTTPPLFRTTLYRTGDREYVFLFIPHHVIWDGWSWDILLRELAALYDAFHRGAPSPLPDLPVQYADVAAWHRTWLHGPELERQMTYWRRRLASPLPVLQLPLDSPRPRIMSQRGMRRVLDLDPAAIATMRTLARGESATLFMALLTAYEAFLHRMTGQADILVGAPIQNRQHPDAQRLIGAFVNTLVLRGAVEPDLTFRDLLRRTRDACIEAYAHQDVPFEHLVEALQPERTLSHAPLFQTLFTFQDVTTRPAAFADLALTQVHVPTHDAPTDLLLGIMADRERTIGVFDFNADLFQPATMDRLVAAFLILLGDAARRPDAPIWSLAVLPAAERHRVVHGFNDTERPRPMHRSVADAVAAQIAAGPDRPAVRGADASWTYRDLDERADAIADRLAAGGVVEGDLVALCLDRSPDMVASILAVWRMGAAWVPLDPEHPAERNTWVLQHSRARAVVVTAATAAAAEAQGVTQVSLDGITTVPPRAGRHPGATSPLAYVLYTSGSTGRPKGVQISHASVLNFLAAMAERPGFGPADRLLAVTTLAFDIAVLELLLPLTTGGEVVMADAATVRDGSRLAHLLAATAPTVMQATPSTWRMLRDAGWQGTPGLRALCGGEALPPSLAADLAPRVNELWNMYGPTETTVWSTCGRVAAGDDIITVGTPIANTRVYVLDAQRQPLPIGIAGEIWIGGRGVTLGYLHAPELTADRLMPDPVLGPAAGDVYRTGDLGRWLPDGRLQHLGRLDRQIKVRGHRVEPGEIEAALEALDEVAQAVVVARGQDEERRLVAYVVFANGTGLTSTDLRRRLASRLPPYMVPGLVVPMDALPLTPNGKVDHHALPDQVGRAMARPRREPPATPMERVVGAIWSDLLDGAAVGRQDNFFELGGHSLQSIRAVALIEERLGQRVDPRLFFFQSLAQIAAGIAQDATTAPAPAS